MPGTADTIVNDGGGDVDSIDVVTGASEVFIEIVRQIDTEMNNALTEIGLAGFVAIWLEGGIFDTARQAISRIGQATYLALLGIAFAAIQAVNAINNAKTEALNRINSASQIETPSNSADDASVNRPHDRKPCP